MSDPTVRCSDAARERADPLVGTAPPARRWLLLEHPGPWRVDALAGSGIEPSMLDTLRAAAARNGARILLVRRPGRSSRSRVRQWLLASLNAATVSGEWSADEELTAAVAAMDSAPPAGPPGEPVVLVCAHGVHDVCCAVRGRPVAAALAERWPEAVWECSHVGGDRFAPNVVLLPDGYYYGNLDPDRAVQTVAEHLHGRVPAPHLRGMAAYEPIVQAAVVAAYARFGPLPPHAIGAALRSHTPPVGADPGRSVVELQVPGQRGPLTVSVHNTRRDPAQLTCRATSATPATDFSVGEFRLTA